MVGMGRGCGVGEGASGVDGDESEWWMARKF